MKPESGHDMDDFEDVRRRYRADAAGFEPPEALDRAILAASRRAVGAGPARLEGRHAGWRWQAPLAAAAVVVLATSLAVLFLPRDGGLPGGEAPPAPPGAAGPAAPRDGRQRPEDGAGSGAASPPAVAESGDERKAGTRQKGAAEEPVAQVPDVGRPTGQETMQATAPRAADATPAPASSESAMAKSEASNRRDEETAGYRYSEVERGRAQEAPAAVASAPAASPAPPPARAAAAPSSAEDSAGGAPSAFVLPAERQLEQIRQLWVSGQRAEAARRFEAFLRDHPAFPIPADFPVPRPAAR